MRTVASFGPQLHAVYAVSDRYEGEQSVIRAGGRRRYDVSVITLVLRTREKLAPLLLWKALSGTNCTMSLIIFSPYWLRKGLSSASSVSCGSVCGGCVHV